jgi:predicted RNase H-like nuclease (RuvC/YqgF family)
MSGWARSKYRSTSPAPLDDLAHKLHVKASNSTSQRLEKGINLLEDALAKCNTDDAYKSTLELYATHVKTQRADIAALRAELERTKKPVINNRSKIDVLETNLAEKERECIELRSQVEKLETRLQSSEKSIDACCSQLLEERQWRKAAIGCLHDELTLVKETARLTSAVQQKKTTPTAEMNKHKKPFQPSQLSGSSRKLTKKNLEENENERKSRPDSAPPQQCSENTSEESLIDETEEMPAATTLTESKGIIRDMLAIIMNGV